MHVKPILFALLLLPAGCAVTGGDHPRPRPQVEERSQPVESASPYEAPVGQDAAKASPPVAPPGTAPRTRAGGGGELPAAASVLLAQAAAQRDGGRLQDAAVTLERALRIAPREPRIYRELAEVRMMQGKVAQAEQFARKGISLAADAEDEQARLWTIVAECRWKNQDSEGAMAAEARARELRGSSWQWWR